jgi:predicted 2-oxoglutarate/Fe(II)-dependent dioxygenase YbiX
MIQNLLTNILITPNVISKDGINFILNHIKNKPKENLSVFDPDKSNQTNQTEFSVDKDIRDTQIIDMSDIMNEIHDLYKNIVFNVINPFYGFEIRDSESPQLLRYGVGGHYKPHYDGVSLWKAPNGDVIWRKSTDRDLSTVLFLNDDFDGGHFEFPEFRIKVKPEPGLLVCFPSNQNYLHGVEPVTKEERFSIVNWMTVKGFPSMDEETKTIYEKYNIDCRL